MIRSSTTLMRFSVAIVVGAPGLFWNGTLPMNSQASFVSSAEAGVGRPLTPVSYAGVARRTTRRAVAVGATAGAVYAPVVAVPSCGQAVDAYGRIVTVCR
ncbi:MAG: hypothetical protein QOD94_3315 [Alphaproteobacteria bacterium]|jgi:hypothetical protein|nr:hypothetical protein [Alphaproteobacteria bacterium]